MKLRDAIENRDFSLFKEINHPSFYNYYDTLTQELYKNHTNIEWETHDAIERSGRVKQYAVREWLCTDTMVGLYLYLIDDEPVCLMYQSGRKCYPEWTFLSEDALKKTKALFDEYIYKDEPIFSGVNEDLLELHLDETLFNRGV